MSHNLFSQISSRVSNPNASFMRMADGAVLSYGEAFALSARYANVLRNKGVVIGDRVAVQVEKSP